MKIEYIGFYNNLIKLTTNKKLYEGYVRQDSFNDRLVFFLLHFVFFLKAFKNKDNKKIIQEIYDFNFRQLELSIREIGYGDQTINKKMKDYLNLFHRMISEIHYWEKIDIIKKKDIFHLFLKNSSKTEFLIDYFQEYFELLKKKTLNSYLKSVID